MHQRNSAATSTRLRNWTARSITLGACLITLAASVTGCAHAQAKAQPELPPLEMPAPPPRVVQANEPVQPPQIALPEEPRTNLRQPTTSAPQRTDAPRQPEPPKQDQPPAEPPKVAEEPARSSPPPTTLQTTPAQREGEVERRVRTLIAQAYNDLNRVNYQALNADARNQYDTAKRFASQAEDALRARNLVFASNLADKAAALAAQLPGK